MAELKEVLKLYMKQSCTKISTDLPLSYQLSSTMLQLPRSKITKCRKVCLHTSSGETDTTRRILKHYTTIITSTVILGGDDNEKYSTRQRRRLSQRKNFVASKLGNFCKTGRLSRVSIVWSAHPRSLDSDVFK